MNQLDLQLVAFKEFGRVAETPVTIIKRDSDPTSFLTVFFEISYDEFLECRESVSKSCDDFP